MFLSEDYFKNICFIRLQITILTPMINTWSGQPIMVQVNFIIFMRYTYFSTRSYLT